MMQKSPGGDGTKFGTTFVSLQRWNSSGSAAPQASPFSWSLRGVTYEGILDDVETLPEATTPGEIELVLTKMSPKAIKDLASRDPNHAYRKTPMISRLPARRRLAGSHMRAVRYVPFVPSRILRLEDTNGMKHTYLTRVS